MCSEFLTVFVAGESDFLFVQTQEIFIYDLRKKGDDDRFHDKIGAARDSEYGWRTMSLLRADSNYAVVACAAATKVVVYRIDRGRKHRRHKVFRWLLDDGLRISTMTTVPYEKPLFGGLESGPLVVC